eukprot:Sdes_comp19878_c0_seq1m12178
MPPTMATTSSYYDMFLNDDFFTVNPTKLSEIDSTPEFGDLPSFGLVEDVDEELQDDSTNSLVPFSPETASKLKNESSFLSNIREPTLMGSSGKPRRSTLPNSGSFFPKDTLCVPPTLGLLSDPPLSMLSLIGGPTQPNRNSSVVSELTAGYLSACEETLDDVEENEEKKFAKLEKNRRSARECRKRKKEYIQGLEKQLEYCTNVNQELRHKIDALEAKNLQLFQQIELLKKGA